MAKNLHAGRRSATELIAIAMALSNISSFLYIFVSNESTNTPVYFDNLRVKHTRGALLEETHYYPFGLVQSNISSKAAGGIENKKKFNGIEYNTDFDINVYDAVYRTLDPQIGRFLQIDPKPGDMESPYAAMGNNPIFNIDPLGDTVILSKAFRNNKAAMAGFELYRNTDAFKKQYGSYDIANGYAGGKEDGDQSANTNIVFDLFDNTNTKGLTELKLANEDGEQTERYNVDQSKVENNTKAELRISIDPTIHTTKTGFAVALNHEGSVHAAALLKMLSVLRNNGATDFFSQIKSASTSPKDGVTSAVFKSRFLTNEIFTVGLVWEKINCIINIIKKCEVN